MGEPSVGSGERDLLLHGGDGDRGGDGALYAVSRRMSTDPRSMQVLTSCNICEFVLNSNCNILLSY